MKDQFVLTCNEDFGDNYIWGELNGKKNFWEVEQKNTKPVFLTKQESDIIVEDQMKIHKKEAEDEGEEFDISNINCTYNIIPKRDFLQDYILDTLERNS